MVIAKNEYENTHKNYYGGGKIIIIISLTFIWCGSETIGTAKKKKHTHRISVDVHIKHGVRFPISYGFRVMGFTLDNRI